MHDANGTPLKVGDEVMIPGIITQLCEGTPDYCNVTVQTQLGRRPDGCKESFSWINTAQIVLLKRAAVALLALCLTAALAVAQAPCQRRNPPPIAGKCSCDCDITGICTCAGRCQCGQPDHFRDVTKMKQRSFYVRVGWSVYPGYYPPGYYPPPAYYPPPPAAGISIGGWWGGAWGRHRGRHR